jgi:hypothetical protein
MPSFTVPFEYRFADPDPSGPIRRLMRSRLLVSVGVAGGGWADNVSFTLDSGANYTAISATRARLLGIPSPAATSRLGLNTAGGARPGLVHDGELRVRLPQLPGRVFRLYCVFAEEIVPSAAPVFGLNDFLDEFRVTLGGRFTPDAPFGRMLFETV